MRKIDQKWAKKYTRDLVLNRVRPGCPVGWSGLIKKIQRSSLTSKLTAWQTFNNFAHIFGISHEPYEKKDWEERKMVMKEGGGKKKIYRN